jgi:hypothetical protein
MLSWWSCYVQKSLHTTQTIGTNGHQLCQENTCASHNHGAQLFFWELRDAYFFIHLDSYVYEKRVEELMCDINYQQTTKREAWFGTNSACTLCENRAAKGLCLFVGGSGCFFFLAPGLI